MAAEARVLSLFRMFPQSLKARFNAELIVMRSPLFTDPANLSC